MLDDLPKIAKLDPGGILSSIEHLPEQIEDAWKAIKELDLRDYGSCQNIVVCGMGGSALGGRIVKALEFKSLRAPIEIVNGYTLPNYVNEKTLLILYSYSGGTEETIAAAHDGVKRRAKIVGVTCGGKLAQVLEDYPIYKIDPTNNPSGQPRMGLGYSIVSIIGILSKLEFINIKEEEIEKCKQITEKYIVDFGARVHTNENPAKKLAEKFASKVCILISSEHLSGSAYAFKNQINENAKTFSDHFEISELNHHLMEGLKYPMKAKEILRFLFIESPHYYERIIKRYGITQDVVKQNGFGYDVYKTLSKEKFEEVFEILVLGSYMSFYMAILHGINPTPIPWVDYFKKKME